jgi:hypothetical protein
VFVGRLLEEIVNAFLFHEARDEVEIRLAVLDAVISRGEVAVELEFEIAKVQVFENLLDNVWNFFVLEDAAIGGPGQEPKPRDHLGVVCSEFAILVPLREAADETVPVAVFAVGVLNGNTYRFADDILETEGVVFREKVEIEVK